MAGINWSRVLIGGLGAGVVMNVVDAVLNGVLLQGQWATESNALNPRILTAGTTSMIGWILVDFITALFMVWLYAAIRPRYGAGAGTAMKAGIATWGIAHVWMMSYVFMNLFSANLMLFVAAGALVGTLAGAYVGGMLYREEGEDVVRRADAV